MDKQLRRAGAVSIGARAMACFDHWLDVEASDREAYLARLQAEDPEAREALEKLIRANDDANARHFLVDSALADTLRDTSQPSPSIAVGHGHQRIGPWTLLESLGTGGMGRVWLAQRDDGLFDGQVAIKMLRDQSPDALAVERFHREGRILARLTHPNIARLLDAGVLADGQRYLVLEYVRGERIDRYCDARKLDVAARIGLFRQVCAAVDHAHANLVVHRDLKPANILVMTDGVVKLLDFGVAKLLEDHAESDDSQLTRAAGSAMTPEYAAPEQIENGVITTVTDVYSLGVVLYRLLGGTSPYGSESASPARLARQVVEIAPPLVSDTFATFGETTRLERARARGGTPDRLRRQLQGDIDNIVAKALRKSPAERYPSVAALLADLDAYLDCRPVAARPDRWHYLLGKFVRRHRLGVAAGAVSVSLLIAAVSGMVWQARIAIAERANAEHQAALAGEQAELARSEAQRAVVEEQRARSQQATAERYRATAQLETIKVREQQQLALQQARRARAESVKADAIKDFLLDIFRVNSLATEDVDKAGKTTARELLEIGSQRIGTKFADQPQVRKELLDIMGEMFYRLGDHEKATSLAREYIAVVEASNGANSPDVRGAYHDLRYALQARGDTVGARAALDRVEQITKASGMDDSREHGWILAERGREALSGDPAAALALAEKALGHLNAQDHLSEEVGIRRLAGRVKVDALILQERYEEALDTARAMLELGERSASADSSLTIVQRGLVGRLERQTQDFERAERTLSQALATARRRMGRQHRDTLAIQAELGALHCQRAPRASECALLAEAVRATAKDAESGLPAALAMRLELAQVEFEQGRFTAAEALTTPVVAVLEGHPEQRLLLARALTQAARLATVRGALDEASAKAERAVALAVEVGLPKLPSSIQAHVANAEALTAAGQFARARSVLAQADKISEVSGLSFATNRAAQDLAAAEMLRRKGELEAGLMQSFDLRDRVALAAEPKVYTELLARTLLGIGRTQRLKGDLTAARPLLEQAVRLRGERGTPESPWLAEARVALADCLISQGETASARRLLAQAEAAFASNAPLGRQFLYPLEQVRRRLP